MEAGGYSPMQHDIDYLVKSLLFLRRASSVEDHGKLDMNYEKMSRTFLRIVKGGGRRTSDSGIAKFKGMFSSPEKATLPEKISPQLKPTKHVNLKRNSGSQQLLESPHPAKYQPKVPLQQLSPNKPERFSASISEGLQPTALSRRLSSPDRQVRNHHKSGRSSSPQRFIQHRRSAMSKTSTSTSPDQLVQTRGSPPILHQVSRPTSAAPLGSINCPPSASVYGGRRSIKNRLAEEEAYERAARLSSDLWHSSIAS